MGTIVLSPSTPVAATPLASVPSYDLPIRAESPFDQPAVTGLPSASTASARPLSQSTTAFTERMSDSAPSSTQPVERAVPAMSTAAYA